VLTWQIQPHDALRDEIVSRSSTRGRVQLIRGEAGVGKTTLAASVSKAIGAQGITVLPVIGMRELASVPLAAMAPVLALASSVADLSAAERLQRLFSVMSGADGAGGGRYALAIDDGPLLDEMSASAMYQLVRVYGVRCIMTARSDQALTGPLVRLLDEALVDTVELRGLTEEQASRAVQQAIAGPLEPSSLGRLVRLAGGNPLFLRELTIAAEQRDAIRSTSRGLEIDILRLPVHLRDGISERFGDLNPIDREAVDVLAVAEPLPVDAIDSAVLERLRGALLVTTTQSGLYLSHPLFAEVILSELSVAEAADRRLTAAALLEASGPADDARFRAACLRLGTAAPPAASELVWASRYAEWLDDHATFLRLADAAVAAEPSVSALVARAQALSWARRWDEAEASFERAASLADSDGDRVLVASGRGTHLAFHRGDARAAVALGEAAITAIAEVDHRDELAGHIEKWRLVGGEPLSAVAGPLGGGSASLHVALVTAMRAVFAGDIDGAITGIREGEPLIDAGRTSVPHARALFDFIEICTRVYQGRMDEARQRAAGLWKEPFAQGVGAFAYVLGLVELHAGRIDECLEASNAAIQDLAWLDFAGLQPPAIALRAAANARLGNATAARSDLDSLRGPMLSNANVMAQRGEAEAWMLAYHGRFDEAATVIAETATSLAVLGHWGLVAPTAHLAVRLGKPVVVIDLLRSAAEYAPGPFVDAMAMHAAAALDNDAEALMRAARALADTGQCGAAIDAADHAAALFRTARAAESDRKAARFAAALAEQSSDFRLRRPASRSGDLTERERAVAEAAAGRESSKEIADRLGLSVRTVDNHLANVYRKLGVGGRAELRGEL
jgi:DNA-binding CsgD family transcriptional regulator